MMPKSQIKRAIGKISPPFLIEWARQLKHTLLREKFEWEYVPAGWDAERTDPNIKGWNVESILNVYRAKWNSFVQELEGTDPLGTSPEAANPTSPDLEFHNTIMIFAYALALAARHKSSISMLDWGGGLGHYYLFSKALVPDLEIEYHCKDVPVLAEYGQQLLPQAHFYSDDSCLSGSYDFSLASTSLHYSKDWKMVLEGLARATNGYLLVTQLPVTSGSPSYVFVQRPYRYHYSTEYLGWCLNRTEFLNCAQNAGLGLVREFINGHRPPIAHAPAPCEYRAFLFGRVKGVGRTPDNRNVQ